MDTHSAHSDVRESRMVSRRTLVRAGATAAWSVPVIQVVGAAPAFASHSVGHTALAVPTLTGVYQSGTTLRITGSVKNEGTTATDVVTLNLTLPTSTTGGTVNSGAFTGTTTTLVAPSIPAAGTVTFDVTYTVSATPAGNVTAIATADNADMGTMTSPVAGGSFQQKSNLSWTSYTAAWQGGGQTLKVTGTLANTSATAATSLTLKVTLPAGNTASNVTIGQGGWTRVGSGTANEFTFTGANLVQGSPRNVELTFTTTGFTGGAVKSVASATNATADATVEANVPTLTASTVVLWKKTENSAFVMPEPVNNQGNKQYTVELRAHNNGPRYVQDVIVKFTSSKDSILAPSDNGVGGWTRVSNSGGVLTYKYAPILAVNDTSPASSITFSTQGNAAATVSVTATNAT